MAEVCGPSTTQHHSLHDWNKCVFCQADTSEVLRCPVESKRSIDQGAGYKSVADLLMKFSQIGCLPPSINISQLDDGEGIAVTLYQHKAKWHDSCRLMYNQTKLRRAEKRKRKRSADAPEDITVCSDSEDTCIPKRLTRQNLKQTAPSISGEYCFFCGQPSSSVKPLRLAATKGLNEKVHQCALKLQDNELLAKLSKGDLIAQDAQYHIQCLVSLYNSARAKEAKPSSDSDMYTMNEGIVFAELVSYIEDCCLDSTTAPVFKLADLVNMYSTRLIQLGTDVVERVHSTKLKSRILNYFHDMEAYKKGRDVMLAFNKDIGHALSVACDHDSDTDAVCLARAANIVRRDMFKMKNQFNGSFEEKCQEESVPASLLALVSMVVNGPNIEAQTSSSAMPQPILTISQLLLYNSLVRRRKNP